MVICSFPSQWQTHVIYKTFVVTPLLWSLQCPDSSWNCIDIEQLVNCVKSLIWTEYVILDHRSSRKHRFPSKYLLLSEQETLSREVVCFVTFCVGRWRTSVWWNIRAVLWCAYDGRLKFGGSIRVQPRPCLLLFRGRGTWFHAFVKHSSHTCYLPHVMLSSSVKSDADRAFE